jgi:hypothetical protein
MDKINSMVTYLSKGALDRLLSLDFLRVTPGQVLKLCQLALRFSQSLLALAKQPGIFNLKAVGKISKVLKSHVYTNRFTMMDRRFKLALNRKADKPSIPFTEDSTGLDLAHYLAVQFNLERAYFGKSELIIFEQPAKLRVGKAGVAVFTLEAWEAGGFTSFASSEESFEGLVHPVQYVLQDLAEYTTEFRPNFFDSGQLFTLVIEANRNVAHLVCAPPFVQRGVVEFPTHFQSLLKFGLLSVSWKYAELVRLMCLHGLDALLSFHVLFDGFGLTLPAVDAK